MDYIKILKDFISIDNTVPPGRNYEKAIDFLEPLFKSVGLRTKKILVPPEHAEGRKERYSLICRRPAEGKPHLVFYGHLDVVPAEGWDAFKPREEDGKIYGRGAADMKGGIIGLLLALDELKGKSLKYDISVLITVDEELSQATQLRYLKQYLPPVKDAYVFSLDSSAGFVSVAALGLLQMWVKVKGHSVHSGLAHMGENAVEKAVPVMQALLDLKTRVVQRKSAVAAHPDSGLARMEARLNLNKIDGGLKANIIPDECEITIDRRLIPEENIEDAEKEIMDTLSSVQNVKWEISHKMIIPTVPPCNGPVVDELAEIIKKVTGQTGKFGEMGSGDLHAVSSLEWGASCFGLGVIRPECNIHGHDEFAYKKDIENLSLIISIFLRG